MEQRAALREIKETFDSRGIFYREFKLQAGYRLLAVPEWGRYLGPFGGEDDRSLGWIHRAAEREGLFARFVEEGEWNLGGDRIWIAPEFPFFVEKRKAFHKTYRVQKGIDPGQYSLSEKNRELFLTSELGAKLFEHSLESKSVRVTRRLRQAGNPLGSLESCGKLMDSVDYIGYEQEIRMEDTSPEKSMELEIWNLLQLPGGGRYLIPYFGEEPEYVDYYASTGGELLQNRGSYVELRVMAEEEHKIGFRSAVTVGRIGYMQAVGGGKFCLLVRNYFNDPSDPYLKDPYDRPGEAGCSLFVYMDGQGKDGFTEMESAGRTFGGSTGRVEDIMTIGYWYYIGKEEALLQIASRLLGIK